MSWSPAHVLCMFFVQSEKTGVPSKKLEFLIINARLFPGLVTQSYPSGAQERSSSGEVLLPMRLKLPRPLWQVHVFLLQDVGGRQGAHLWRLLRARGVAGCFVISADLHCGCVAPGADPSAEAQPSCNLKGTVTALGALPGGCLSASPGVQRQTFKHHDSLVPLPCS